MLIGFTNYSGYTVRQMACRVFEMFENILFDNIGSSETPKFSNLKMQYGSPYWCNFSRWLWLWGLFLQIQSLCYSKMRKTVKAQA